MLAEGDLSATKAWVRQRQRQEHRRLSDRARLLRISLGTGVPGPSQRRPRCRRSCRRWAARCAWIQRAAARGDAPEKLHEQSLTAAADCYSLGVILFESLGNRSSWARSSSESDCTRACTADGGASGWVSEAPHVARRRDRGRSPSRFASQEDLSAMQRLARRLMHTYYQQVREGRRGVGAAGPCLRLSQDESAAEQMRVLTAHFSGPAPKKNRHLSYTTVVDEAMFNALLASTRFK